ncbi:hypothetical protein SMSP2_01409 [Limihaloglobus sulfuriphilus]|uniref:PEP-CTERM protein-sorting domain-containing protein n=1 Tax=Limihaloglobus sulfuriphilus TaxID=1851148 RepID=A0A1Q2MEC0_9BACT|nr:hypothetical protein [Limihaloglobus sulfuriphilus]AQQ71045.1 hypothetical protein SMSP2_01409 [Limihaloglobus sulfuriphilus]
MLSKGLFVNYLVVLTLFCVSFVYADALQLMYDPFNDSERDTQNLPSSAKWYTRSDSSTLFVNTGVANYRIETSVSAGNQFWAHFTESGSPVNLQVGESIDFTFNALMPVASDGSWDRTLWFGLFNSNGTRDAADGSGVGAARTDDTGYFVITNPGVNSINRSTVNKVTPSTASDHFVHYTNMANTSSWPMQAEAQYQVGLTVARTGESEITLSGRTGPSNYTFSGIVDSSDVYSVFDTISFYYDGRGFPGDTGAIAADYVTVVYNQIPEPATFVLLAAMVPFFRKTRKQ